MSQIIQGFSVNEKSVFINKRNSQSYLKINPNVACYT